MKKLILIFLTIILLAFTACTNNSAEAAVDNNANNVVSSEEQKDYDSKENSKEKNQPFSFSKEDEEFNKNNEIKDELQKILNDFGDPPKIVVFQSYYADYLEDGSVVISGFLRNGTNCSVKNIIGNMYVKSGDGKVIASGVCEFGEDEFGIISPGESKYKRVSFEPDQVLCDNASFDTYSVEFKSKYDRVSNFEKAVNGNQRLAFDPLIDESSLDIEARNRYQEILNDFGDPPKEKVAIEVFFFEYLKDDSIEATAFLRNGFDYPIKNITGNIDIKSKDNKTIVSLSTKFNNMIINAYESTPVEFIFSIDSVFKDEVSLDTCLVEYNLNSERSSVVNQKYSFTPLIDRSMITDELKNKLQEVLNNLGDPPKGRIGTKGINSVYLEDGSLQISVFIRNGFDYPIKNIRGNVYVKTLDGEDIAQGYVEVFEEDFGILNPNESRFWNIKFPPNMVFKKDVVFGPDKFYELKTSFEYQEVYYNN